MYELKDHELTLVAGAGFSSAIYSGLLAGVASTGGGAIIGGVHGGDGGGLLGIGSIGQCVGMCAGGAIGLVTGSIYGFAYGWDHSDEVENISVNFYKNVISGSFYPGTSTNNTVHL
ncbi:colicin V synthesis protein [Mangrovibacter plantisponsor]|uniref:Colicin V synthesis protein n=1 Tax=Mangrovibacter plantisponsor TaxID=451513 RepID=A0A317PWM5_9ENTR|nr:colicin V synthesis protein [Mangrovibacter plantisponsor]PWW07078.1 hypothetical protein DES37_109198 [Mangrovibacter plantisponsor]